MSGSSLDRIFSQMWLEPFSYPHLATLWLVLCTTPTTAWLSDSFIVWNLNMYFVSMHANTQIGIPASWKTQVSVAQIMILNKLHHIPRSQVVFLVTYLHSKQSLRPMTTAQIDVPSRGSLGYPGYPYTTLPYPNDARKVPYPTREAFG